jgi:hypothetical protein
MNRIARRLAWSSAAPLVAMLTACSPHPAAGNWQAAENTDSGFTRLEVTYEGRANLYEAGEEEAGRHCFWGVENAQGIALTCKPAFDTAIEERYQLSVGENGTATLMRDGTVIARFTKQQP